MIAREGRLMSSAFHISAALLAALAGLATILLILWPGWIASLDGGNFVLPWAGVRGRSCLSMAPDSAAQLSSAVISLRR